LKTFLSLALSVVLGCSTSTMPRNPQGPRVNHVLLAAAAPVVTPAPAAAPTPAPVKKGQESPFEWLFTPEPPKPKLEPKKGKHYYPLIKIDEAITRATATRVVDLIEQANKAKAEGIVIELDSPGGSVMAGMDIVHAIEDSDIPVKCIDKFESASMAAVIFESCSERVMLKPASLMFHEVRLSANFSLNPNEAQSLADWLKATQAGISEVCIAQSNVTMGEFYAKTNGGREWWVNWEEALATGFADKTAKSEKEYLKTLRN
jgi:ATP-dependent protease ClpP protease subunit